jgi:hypothetical protein
LVLSQHEGGECLDDVVHIAKDKALRLTLVVFTQASKPSADGLWGWYLLIGDKTQSLVFGNMNNIV